jgi:hypothetical protein
LFRGNNKCEPEAQIQWDDARELLLTTSDHFLCPHDISIAQDSHVRSEHSPSREAAKLSTWRFIFVSLPRMTNSQRRRNLFLYRPLSILSYHFPNGLFPSVILQQSVSISLLSTSCHMHVCLILFDLTTPIMHNEDHTPCRSLLCSFLLSFSRSSVPLFPQSAFLL